MNTYLVPTTASYCYDVYDYIYMVHANSHKEAYEIACKKLQGEYIPLELTEYECYPFELYKPQDTYFDPFYKGKKYDILKEAFKNTKGAEHMAFFQVNWNNYTEALANKAAPETWSNTAYPDNGILANYLVHTYKKLKVEKSIIKNKDKNYALFNTGLYTKYYDEIFAYSDDQDNIEFLTGYELSGRGIEERPLKANYFSKPELLVFDWHLPIDVQFDHILDDSRNRNRLPQSFLEKDNKVCILTGAIELMKKRVAANYKLAIPQYYENKLQLLLPLCLDTDDQHPNLALAVSKLDTCYQGHTCLTLDMAYNNARLIAKPESNWLSL